jgi:hypothetical protein
MRETCREIQSAADATPAQKINAQLHVLFGDGDALVGRFTNGAMQARARQDIGLPSYPADQQAAEELAADWQKWDSDAQNLILQAHAEKHPLLLAEAKTAWIPSTRFSSLPNAWQPPRGACNGSPT